MVLKALTFSLKSIRSANCGIQNSKGFQVRAVQWAPLGGAQQSFGRPAVLQANDLALRRPISQAHYDGSRFEVNASFFDFQITPEPIFWRRARNFPFGEVRLPSVWRPTNLDQDADRAQQCFWCVLHALFSRRCAAIKSFNFDKVGFMRFRSSNRHLTSWESDCVTLAKLNKLNKDAFDSPFRAACLEIEAA